MGKIKDSFNGFFTLFSNKKVFLRLLAFVCVLILGLWLLSEKSCVTKWFQYGQKQPQIMKASQ